jgi:hypothetical protein
MTMTGSGVGAGGGAVGEGAGRGWVGLAVAGGDVAVAAGPHATAQVNASGKSARTKRLIKHPKQVASGVHARTTTGCK